MCSSWRRFSAWTACHNSGSILARESCFENMGRAAESKKGCYHDHLGGLRELAVFVQGFEAGKVLDVGPELDPPSTVDPVAPVEAGVGDRKIPRRRHRSAIGQT